MGPLYRSPFGNRGDAEWGVGTEPPPWRDGIPRSLPEDRNEGNLNPDPVLECWIDGTCSHSPSGDPSDDDGAGNPSPRETPSAYGLEDADFPDTGGSGAT